jgi:hypothetical protein
MVPLHARPALHGVVPDPVAQHGRPAVPHMPHTGVPIGPASPPGETKQPRPTLQGRVPFSQQGSVMAPHAWQTSAVPTRVQPRPCAQVPHGCPVAQHGSPGPPQAPHVGTPPASKHPKPLASSAPSVLAPPSPSTHAVVQSPVAQQGWPLAPHVAMDTQVAAADPRGEHTSPAPHSLPGTEDAQHGSPAVPHGAQASPASVVVQPSPGLHTVPGSELTQHGWSIPPHCPHWVTSAAASTTTQPDPAMQ